MELVVATGGTEHEVSVSIADPQATVADLLRAVGGGIAPQVDGRNVDPAERILGAGLYSGAHLGAPPSPAPREATWEVVVLTGVAAGRRRPLVGSEFFVGREPDCDLQIADPTVSRRHCQIGVSRDGRPAVLDLGSSNGTLIDGRRVDGWTAVPTDSLVRVGDVSVAVRQRKTDDRPLGLDPRREAGATGTVTFNRPPRELPHHATRKLRAPASPSETRRPPFNVTALTVPLVLGVVMVAVLHNPAYALFALLSPVMILGNWWEGRHRGLRSMRRDVSEYAAAMVAFEKEAWSLRDGELRARRQEAPDLGEILRWAQLPSSRLWERRRDAPDFLRVSCGLGDAAWRPPLEDERCALSPEAQTVLAQVGTLPLVPMAAPLSKGGLLGIVGPRRSAVAAARAVVAQLAAEHGPADLGIAIAVSDEAVGDWDWAKWLPHTKDVDGRGGARLLGAGTAAQDLARELAERRAAGIGERPMLLVLDGEPLFHGRDAPARALLRSLRAADEAIGWAGVVVAATEDRLPSACTSVLTLTSETGGAVLRHPLTGERHGPFVAAGLSRSRALAHSRALARFEDPDVQAPGARLPDRVPLLPLLGLDDDEPATLLRHWTQRSGFAVPIGEDEHGPFRLDLVEHGPHAIIGGTTGSGKSELLRSFVAALAATASPEELTFALIDFKGGTTFLEVAELPHTVGLATDLDAALAQRALRCLRAELTHREERLSAAGLSDIKQFARRDGEPPLPRLVVVIDEFGEMVKALPDFQASLVGIARRGRALGVHLVLATQKPAGAVNADIRANTDIKIALRVQDREDSKNVIDDSAAADISREQAGRAWIRLGPGELTAVQTALASSRTRHRASSSVEVTSFTFGPRPIALREGRGSIGDVRADDGLVKLKRLARNEDDLASLVDQAQRAWAQTQRPAPRRPWLDPLPDVVTLEGLATNASARSIVDGRQLSAGFAVADDPDAQTQFPIGWDLRGGNLLLCGIAGSGTTTALAAAALSLAQVHSADELHLYGLDFGAGELAPLSALPHTGAIVTANEGERQSRLVRHLHRELERRRADGGRAAGPAIVLLVDNFGGFNTRYRNAPSPTEQHVAERFAQVFAEGPSLGIHVAIAADRAGAIPMPFMSVTQQRLAFRLPDRADFGQFAVPRDDLPTFVPGRAVIGGTGLAIQVGFPGDLDRAARSVHTRLPNHPPSPIRSLPRRVEAADLIGHARVGGEPWLLPVGVADDSLEPVGFELYEGDHVVVAGSSRSGRGPVLVGLAELAAAAGARVLAVAPRRSPLLTCPVVDVVDAATAASLASESDLPCLVVVDDAGRVDDGGSLTPLLQSAPRHVHCVIAGAAEDLRSGMHWSAPARRSRTGLWLCPEDPLEGALFNISLRVSGTLPEGRGYLVRGGSTELVQAAFGSSDAVPVSNS